MEDERSVNMETEEEEALGPSLAAPFMRKLQVQPWGVLGTQLAKDGIQERAPLPDIETAIVDPAGLVYIQSLGPASAGGASAVIYEYLGMAACEAFPAEVVSAITRVLDAKHHSYGDKHVVHVVGPDLRCANFAHDDAKAVEALATAYINLLVEFAHSGCRCLRLLPVSGGIFSGCYSDEMPSMTFGALGAAFAHLDPGIQRKVMQADSIDLCVFMEGEFEEFKTALGKIQQGMDALPRVSWDHEESDGGKSGQNAGPRAEQPLSAAIRASRRSATLDPAGSLVSDDQPGSHDSTRHPHKDRPLENGVEQGNTETSRHRSASLSSKRSATSDSQMARRVSFEGQSGSTVVDADRCGNVARCDGTQSLDQGFDSANTQAARTPSGSGVLSGATDAGQPPVLLGAEIAACEDEKSGYMHLKEGTNDDELATEVTHVVLEGGRRQPAHARALQSGAVQAREVNDVGTEVLSESGAWSPALHGVPHSPNDVCDEVLSEIGAWRARAARAHASRDGADQAEGVNDGGTEVLSESGAWKSVRQPQGTARKASRAGVDDPACAPYAGDDTEVQMEGGEWKRLSQVTALAQKIQDLASSASIPQPVNDGTEILSESGVWRPGGSSAQPISQRAGTIVESLDMPQDRGPKRVNLHVKSTKELQSIKWSFGERGGACIKRLGRNFPENQNVQPGDRLRSINGSEVLDLPRDEIRKLWRDEQQRADLLVLEFVDPEP